MYIEHQSLVGAYKLVYITTYCTCRSVYVGTAMRTLVHISLFRLVYIHQRVSAHHHHCIDIEY